VVDEGVGIKERLVSIGRNGLPREVIHGVMAIEREVIVDERGFREDISVGAPPRDCVAQVPR